VPARAVLELLGKGGGFIVEREQTESRAKLHAAWQAVAKRLLDAGYDPEDVFETMAAVALDRSLPDGRQPSSRRNEVAVERMNGPQRG
jgi:hypothetical protein